jgi:hypothetical protein
MLARFIFFVTLRARSSPPAPDVTKWMPPLAAFASLT